MPDSIANDFLKGIALNFEGENIPDLIQLTPAGPRLEGVDGRAWNMADASAVIARSPTPFALDFEHAQDLRAPKGEAAPASAWVTELQIRDGAIWGRVEWTPKARAAIAAREYRFISPAFTYNAKTRDVNALYGGALVNRPNFIMAALNRAEKDPFMNKEICDALGLPETATPAEAAAAIKKLHGEKQNSAQQTDLGQFVPRPDLDAALNRAKTAEDALAARKTAEFAMKVDAAINGAIKDGKIAPGSVDFYRATCSTAEGLTKFEIFIAAQPTFFKEAAAPQAQGAPAGATALNAEQKSAARAFGIPEKDFAAFLAEKQEGAAQ